MRFLVAIDPGALGGLAVFAGAVRCVPLARGAAACVALLARLAGEASAVDAAPVCVIEKVGGFVKGCPAPGSAMFKFGSGVGLLQGAAIALGFRFEQVTPQEWQKPLGLGTRKSAGGKEQWKRLLLAEARRRFPHLKITGRTGDALLMGDYFWTARLGQAPLRIFPYASPASAGRGTGPLL